MLWRINMKDKKILNICLLTFGLVSLITFILPLQKFEFMLEEKSFVKVMFYIFNAVLVVALVSLIVLAIINLFKDNYQFVKIMEALALLGFVMVFLILLIFSTNIEAKIDVGYLLVAIEMFFTANFSQMARLTCVGKQLKNQLNKTESDEKHKKSNNQNVQSELSKPKNDDTIQNNSKN